MGELGIVIPRELLEKWLEELQRGNTDAVAGILTYMLKNRVLIPRKKLTRVASPPLLGAYVEDSQMVSIAVSPLAEYMYRLLFKGRRGVCVKQYMWAVIVYKLGSYPSPPLLWASTCSTLLTYKWAKLPYKHGADTLVDFVGYSSEWDKTSNEAKRQAYKLLASTSLNISGHMHSETLGKGYVSFYMPDRQVNRLLNDFTVLGIPCIAPYEVFNKRRIVYILVENGEIREIKREK
ncbi:MAG: hypothetical protein QW320_05050 [Ignisphaera sp.]